MRQSLLFAFIVVILGAALYALYFIEGGAGQIEPESYGTTSVGVDESAQEPRVPPEEPGHDERGTSSVVRIGGVEVRVVIVSTPEARSRGLSGRAGLASDEGMLFVFAEEGIYSFWMKDMNFSIDMLWLSREGTVVHIESHVSPESYPASFSSPGPAQYVLEVPAGFVKAHGIATGSVATLPE